MSYCVEKLLDKKEIEGKIYYQVKWEGYKQSEATWEPEANIAHLKDLIKEFHQSKQGFKRKLRARKKGSMDDFIVDDQLENTVVMKKVKTK
jgi:hypothetical protein